MSQPVTAAPGNPLLEPAGLPCFDLIRAEHVEPAIDTVLADNRARLAGLLDGDAEPTVDSLVVELERMSHRLSRVWSPVSHLNAVCSTPELRKAHNACLLKLSEYATELGQNRRLFEALERIAAGDCEAPVRALLDKALRDFRLAGVDLPEAERARFATLTQRLSRLQAEFDQNLLDSAESWHHDVSGDDAVAGLPATVRNRAARTAREAGVDGYRFTLDAPTYTAVLTHADDRDLREALYRAWLTRASDQSPHDPRFDNSTRIDEILTARHELASLLGFANFAELSLAKKMAKNTDEVLEFLHTLAKHCRPAAAKELQTLREFAGSELAPWDLAYHAERLRRERFEIDDETLRSYFPAQRAMDGLFRVTERLFDIRIVATDPPPVWHPDVVYYRVETADGDELGAFYADLYARGGKRGGAWMDECIIRSGLEPGGTVAPVAYFCCNFPPPDGDTPSLLSHPEVLTLFHEFGHTLHHLLTRVDWPSVAGINGVPWDAVELPSQFLENYPWSHEVIAMVSGHYQTGEPLPDALFERLQASRTFHAGLAAVRQLEFALFDFRLHTEYRPGLDVLALLDEVRAEVAVLDVPAYNRFPHSFAHIFGGGYAAGYYSYKWAELLAADAWEAFVAEGMFNRDTARRYVDNILAVGGTRDIMEAFRAFRGRAPDPGALLRHLGIAA